MRYIILSLLLIASCSKPMSSIGLSTSYFKENNKDFKTEYKPEATITFTHLFDYKGNKLGYSTNRLDNILTGRRSYKVRFKDGSEGFNKQKITYDAACVGRNLKKWLPMICSLNTSIDNQFYHNNLTIRTVNHAILYSLNMNYIINNKYTVSVNYLFAEKDIYLKGGLSASFNYNF